jgi:hypothetical protein
MSLKIRENNAWVQVSSANGANGANGLDGVDSKVLQIQYEDSNAVETIFQQNVFPITGLSINISPIKTTTKLLLEANIISNAYYVSSFGFALKQGSNYTPVIGAGNTNTNSTNAISTLFSYGDFVAGSTSNANPQPPGVFSSNYLAENMYSLKYRYLYTQSGLTPVGGLTFAPTACSSWANNILPLIINNRLNNDMLSTSSITVKEIEV